jgi:hypothetical protein
MITVIMGTGAQAFSATRNYNAFSLSVVGKLVTLQMLHRTWKKQKKEME